MIKNKRLTDAYHFPQFKPHQSISGVFGDSKARVIKFSRRGKKLFAVSAAKRIDRFMIARSVWFAICPAATIAFIWNLKSGVFSAGGAAR
jgi:hypothetical protein